MKLKREITHKNEQTQQRSGRLDGDKCYREIERRIKGAQGATVS